MLDWPKIGGGRLSSAVRLWSPCAANDCGNTCLLHASAPAVWLTFSRYRVAVGHCSPGPCGLFDCEIDKSTDPQGVGLQRGFQMESVSQFFRGCATHARRKGSNHVFSKGLDCLWLGAEWNRSRFRLRGSRLELSEDFFRIDDQGRPRSGDSNRSDFRNE